MTDIAISVRNVSKCYRAFDDHRSRLLHAVWPNRRQGVQEIWALKDINFNVKRGEAIAIIGRNGGGKSTLLEILTGTLTATTGDVKVKGRVSALLELGSGFSPEYTGRDNVMLNGLLLGLSREEILGRFDEIEAFAEIGVAIDRPVKTYSSGMVMRLAFAVQVLCDPDILIVDEALSVGDFFFQQKCLSYIRGLCAKGVTLLFVSHDMGTVRDICQRAIYLRQGRLVQDENVSDVISGYLSDTYTSRAPINFNSSPAPSILSKITANSTKVLNNALWRNDNQVADVEGRLLAVAVCTTNGDANVVFRMGDTAVVKVAYVSKLQTDCHVGLSILNKYNQLVTVTGSYFTHSVLPTATSDSAAFQIVICDLRIVLLLEAGQYSLDVNSSVTTVPNQGKILDKVPQIGPITIQWDYANETAPFLGQVGLPVECCCYLD